MPRSASWPSVLSIAEEQWGLVTRQQVQATGAAWSTLARQVRSGSLERVAHGVYRVRGAGEPEHLELRAAWLQLSPATPAWERTPEQGVASHRSAAALNGLGHLPADVHEFTLPKRRQTRRDDVRLHRGDVSDGSWNTLHGLPVTRPHRIAADLLAEREDPGAVGELIADALRSGSDDPGTVARAIAPYAASHGLRRGDGIGLLRWLLDLTGDPERRTWLAAASADPAVAGSRRGPA
jgi:predicted transcriptional regulator of viral defense system